MNVSGLRGHGPGTGWGSARFGPHEDVGIECHLDRRAPKRRSTVGRSSLLAARRHRGIGEDPAGRVGLPRRRRSHGLVAPAMVGQRLRALAVRGHTGGRSPRAQSHPWASSPSVASAAAFAAPPVSCAIGSAVPSKISQNWSTSSIASASAPLSVITCRSRRALGVLVRHIADAHQHGPVWVLRLEEWLQLLVDGPLTLTQRGLRLDVQLGYLNPPSCSI